MLLALLACAHRSPPPPPAADGPPEAAAPIAPPAAIDARGLRELLGTKGSNPLVVNVWATWCGPCVSELGMIQAIAPSLDARVVLVNVDHVSDADRVAQFVRDHDVRLPTYHLAVPGVEAVLAADLPGWHGMIPLTLVYGADAALSGTFDGVVTDAQIRAAVDGAR